MQRNFIVNKKFGLIYLTDSFGGLNFHFRSLWEALEFCQFLKRVKINYDSNFEVPERFICRKRFIPRFNNFNEINYHVYKYRLRYIIGVYEYTYEKRKLEFYNEFMSWSKKYDYKCYYENDFSYTEVTSLESFYGEIEYYPY